MKCEALNKNYEECNKEAVVSGTVFTMSGPVTVNACEKHSKRSGFFIDTHEEVNS